MHKEVMQIIRERRSIRHFKPDAVPRELVTELLDAARHAPSGGNMQPWAFYVVLRPDLREGLSRAAKDQRFVAEAPVVIVVCAVPEQTGVRYAQRGRELYCLQDTAAAVQNILLAAHAYGLGTCWVGAFSEEAVGQVLSLPAGHRPVAIIPIGYPERPGRSTSRRPLEEVAVFLE